MGTQNRLTTGVEGVDKLLGGVQAGDNVVWEVDSGAPIETFLRAYADAAQQVGPVVWVSFNRSPQAILRKYDGHFGEQEFVLVDCFTSGKGNSDRVFSEFYDDETGRARTVRVAQAHAWDKVSDALENLEGELGQKVFYVFDSLTGMAELWHDEEEALRFFTYMCPRLYDLNTVAYWVLEKEAHSEQFLARLRHVTQVVLELSLDGSRPVCTLRKAEGRHSPKVGIPQAVRVGADGVEFAPEPREELEVALLSEISEAVGSALDLGKVFDQTMGSLARELRMKRGTVVLLDRASGKLKIAAAHGLSEEEKARGEYDIGEGVTGQVVSTGHPVAVADIRQDPRFLNRTGARRKEGPVAFVCVPLRVDREVVGAISVDRSYADQQTLARDQRLLQIIASLVSQAIRINRMVMVERDTLLAENLRLRKDLRSKYKLGNIVAASGAMQDVVATAGAVAKSNATVLIRGETGTGKELVASVLHYNSDRAQGPFIKVNCGALAESLLESELFGHVRGAFTGAVADRKGRFELADGGTIFLDEIGSMSEKLQVKLLRVLQERQFERVGGTETLHVDVRIVAATNQNLEQLLSEGRFREDLYYRLNVIPILIPPLRERRDDIPFLVEHFLDKYGAQYDKEVSKMSREVVDALGQYHWPGNVRELESCIERAVVLSQDGTIGIELLPVSVRSSLERPGVPGLLGAPDEIAARLVRDIRRETGGRSNNLHDRVISRVEKVLIEETLEANEGVQTRTARELGISRNTLRRKIEDYQLPSPA